MKTRKKVVRLYAIPPELIPESALVANANVTCHIRMPVRIDRTDNDGSKLSFVFEWFNENLNTITDDGYLLCSLALPALSLDANKYNNAIQLLREVLTGFDAVQGYVFVPNVGMTRTNLFMVSDWYNQYEFGSSMARMVSFSNDLSQDIEEQ